MEMTELVGLSLPLARVIDCLDRGISSMLSPYVYKRLERAKMEIEQERSDQNALIAIKEAMTQDIINVARTSRDRLELQNVAEIYGAAMLELQNFNPAQLPSEIPSNEWTAHFYDCAKDCSDDEIRILWSKILVGEIKSPGKYYKRTLTNLKQIEKHEAEWFVELCKYVIDETSVPFFVLQEKLFPYNEFLSLVDCGFVNASKVNMEIKENGVLALKGYNLYVELKGHPYRMTAMALTNTGIQICGLVNTESDESYVDMLVGVLNRSNMLMATFQKD